MSIEKRTIAIYYEHPEWFRPLFAELDRRRISYVRLDASSHNFDPGISEKYGLFFNRMSASAALRGNANAIFYTRYLLHHLDNKDIRVINGERSFAIETSKAMQLSLLDSLGIAHPRTIVVNSPKQVLIAAEEFDFPIIVKPNIGGRGSGIVLFETFAALKRAVETGETA